MFPRLSFPFSRIFRLRNRRAGKADGTAHVARRSSSDRSLSKSRRSVSSRPEPIITDPAPSTSQPLPHVAPSDLSPIPQSPLTPTPAPAVCQTAPIPILIIERDPPQLSVPPPPAHDPPSTSTAQHHSEGTSLLNVPAALPHPSTRRVSFQLPPTPEEEDTPGSPLSWATCSTLVSDAEHEGSVTPETLESGSVGTADMDQELGSEERSVSAGTRPVSLFVPQAVRVDVSRLSLPLTAAARTDAGTKNVKESKRDSKRVSLFPPRSNANLGKKDRRQSRWSIEVNKPETQEVLRALSAL